MDAGKKQHKLLELSVMCWKETVLAISPGAKSLLNRRGFTVRSPPPGSPHVQPHVCLKDLLPG